ncbi:MAG TPA: cation:proton antiporter [Streptosporangiaceae bacterium]|jgi:CPA1 family monovalent cation:H+ antiporter|nr:cation:proton antiporter [Streptosporangiaceae bacterium]
MLNDGTALTVYAVAVSAAAGTGSVSALGAIGSFFLIGLGGIAVGLVLGVALHAIRMRFRAHWPATTADLHRPGGPRPGTAAR